MAKKNRPEPMSEGSLANIHEWFFGPLLQYKPETVSTRDWFEQIFDYKNRDVTRYKCNRPFEMPGLFCAAANVKIQGIGRRHMTDGQVIYVRLDSRKPHIIDIEVPEHADIAEQMFSLNRSEWGFVQLHVEEAERIKK